MIRARSLSLAVLVCLCLATPASAQQAGEWVRGSARNIDYANMQSGVADLFGFFCRKVDNKYVGGIAMKMPVLKIGPVEIRQEFWSPEFGPQ